jgi:hypothetical protein
MDSFTIQLKEDESSGSIIDASIDPELINVASVGVWNESGTTLLRRCDRGHDLNDLVLTLFKDVLSITPDHCSLTYATGSEWLIDQWNDMLEWQSIGCKGLDREACPYQWKGIMEHVETRLSKVTLMRIGDTAITEEIRNAVINMEKRELSGTKGSWRRRMGRNTHRRLHYTEESDRV